VVRLGCLAVLPLDQPDAVRVMFEQLQAHLPDDPSAFLHQAKTLASKSHEISAAAAGWQYVTLSGRHYAWDGPLHEVEDRDAEQIAFDLDPALSDAITERGLIPTWQRPEGVARSGNKQVYLTDLKSWRRKIICRDTVLVVRTP
jgi:hypothetical protein